MNLENLDNNKKIKIVLLMIIFILGIEITFASLLFSVKNENKINNSETIIENNTQNNSLQPISEIEKKAIIEDKNIESPTPKKIDTNPRTRPLP